MKKTEINELSSVVGSEVLVRGFVDSIRDQKNAIFMVMRDCDAKVQIFVQKIEENNYLLSLIKSLTPESVIEVCGILNSNTYVKLNGYEIIPSSINILSISAKPLPIDDTAVLQDRLDWRFLDLRKPKNLLIFRMQTLMEMAMREYFINNKFIEIHSPKIIGAASESGAELFSVKYFNTTAYLAQSPQFYKQMAMAAGFDKVFEIGPVFRANPSFTSRHDTEFTSIDAEISWVESHEDVMALEESWLAYTMEKIKIQLGDTIKEVFGVEIIVPSLPFPRIDMKEALEIVKATGHVIPLEYEGELDPDGERILYEYVKTNLNHEFMFVTGYPKSIRPFYHMRNADGTTKSFDLLFKGLEVTTGAQREHRVEILSAQAVEKKIPLESIGFYLDFFRYGVPPHGGFGFGLTRMLMLLLGLKNVREVTYLYRGPNRLFP